MISEIHYTLTSFEGDYAVLREDSPEGIENRVAIALLPETAAIGSKILFANFEYTEE